MRILISIFILLATSYAQAKLKVVATTTDLKALVQAVGGEHVDVFAIAKGTQDPHQIEAKPSFMVLLRDADLIVSQGLELESAWTEPLIKGSRNTKIKLAAPGNLELGEHLDPIEIPKGTVSRAEGDVHPGGNPHFQLDPIRMGAAAVLVAERLGELDPGQREFYKTHAEAFKKHLEEKTAEWKKRLEKTGIHEVVTYHKTFSYFLDRFNIKGNLQLEPKPGIPPTVSHLLDVIDQMKKRNIRLVLIENYFDEDAANKLKQEVSGVQVFRVPVSVEGDPGLSTSEALFEKIVKTFEMAAK